ncbi:PQQ-binding-like beta-propeller repeat protein [Prosthecobacter sp.]|uniref:PQQ-binding-like beta-propeller repeat protein n=1 Tax=Prosthecobacter sp. TaxID=1965333 RepID=UPI001DBB5207|nr:PQQ-binding-like beta-propeller repeat protein [Prosthecobacter sp.]MCB1274988.1 PQQ-like beta-propeller repeat protein [Prosthecobacter sp.]
MNLFIAFAFATCTLHAATTDWTRFLGPHGTAIVANSQVPLTWSDSENLTWKTDLPGPGSSSPIVFGDKVFVTCWTGYGDKEGANDMSKLTRHLLCLSRADGKIVWEAKVPSVVEENPWKGYLTEHGYATHTPVTDGERVYVFFGKSGALAFDMQGRQLWQNSCGTDSGRMRWGSAASPVLVGDVLVVNASDEAQAIIGLDKKTGKVLWKAEGQFGMAYGTPNVFQHEGVTDLVIAVPQELWGLNPETGKLRWYAAHELNGNVSPSVVLGDSIAYVFGGFPATRSTAIKLGGKGDITADAILWSSNTSSYVPTPILKDGHLYVVNDQGFATCIDAATGKDVYRERVLMGARGGGKPFYASPVLIGDKLVCVSRRDGTFVIAAKPKYELLQTNEFKLDDSHFHGTPAVSGNQLFMRSNKAVYCIGTK